MKSSIFTLSLVACFFSIGLTSLSGQTLRRDYVVDAPVQYKVTDPWDRGRVFRNHIGHGGFFYNCDNEECKRNSPYLCFKSEHRGPRESCLATWRRQLAEVKWRLNAGGCCTQKYPGADCDPDICLACNVHPGLPSIDYSKLTPGTATLPTRETTTPNEAAPAGPTPRRNPTTDYYRSGSRLKRRSNSYFASVPQSIDDQTRSRRSSAYYRSNRTMPNENLPTANPGRSRLHSSIVMGNQRSSRNSASQNQNRNQLIPVADAIAAQKQKIYRSKNWRTAIKSEKPAATTAKRFRLLR